MMTIHGEMSSWRKHLKDCRIANNLILRKMVEMPYEGEFIGE
tara:strand:- start:14249 stop:14374 length:126 start_codon:yes stop_codon:yes gene_type:complete